MAIITPLQVPTPSEQNRDIYRAPATPRRAHTPHTHTVGLVIDITLALIVVLALLFMLF
jgi:hypothetical protein